MNNRIRKTREAGTAIVETALTLSLFTAIVFSLFDFGYIMFLHQTLAARAEAAARYGALNPTDTTGMKNYVLYFSTTGSGPGLFGLTTSNVSATRTGAGTNDDRVVVTVSGYQFFAIAPALKGTGKPITVSMPVENN
jgi:Flp pilus assembly protein TadG